MKRILLLPVVFALLFISGFAQDKQPKVIKYQSPTYSPAARATGTQGEVVVTVSVDTSGNITLVKVENGHPLLRAACEVASKNWKFSPLSESREREVKLIYLFRLKTNSSFKNNYKDSKITSKFKNLTG